LQAILFRFFKVAASKGRNGKRKQKLLFLVKKKGKSEKKKKRRVKFFHMNLLDLGLEGNLLYSARNLIELS